MDKQKDSELVSPENTLMREIQEMQKSVHCLQMRVKELSEENTALRKQLKVLTDAHL